MPHRIDNYFFKIALVSPAHSWRPCQKHSRELRLDACFTGAFCGSNFCLSNISSIQPPDSITAPLLPNLLSPDPAIPFPQLGWISYSSSYIFTTRNRTARRRPSFSPFARPRTPGGDVRSCFLSSCLHRSLRGCKVRSSSREARRRRSILRGRLAGVGNGSDGSEVRDFRASALSLSHRFDVGPEV